MELTREYFDQQLSKLATKDDLDQKLGALETRLKAYADTKQEELAGMIENTVNVSSRVAKLESDITAIKQALKLA